MFIFKSCLGCKAKQLQMNGYGKKRKKKPIAPSRRARPRKGHFGPVRLISKHNGVALTNINLKNLSENFGLRGRQDHYDAYVQDVKVAWVQVEVRKMAKCLQVDESPTKTRTGGLTAEPRNKTSRGLPDVSYPRTSLTQILCKRFRCFRWTSWIVLRGDFILKLLAWVIMVQKDVYETDKTGYKSSKLRWSKRFSPTLRRVSRKAPVRNANLWIFEFGNNTNIWYAKSRMG